MAKEVLITNDGIFIDRTKMGGVISYSIKENGQFKSLTLEIPIENTLFVERGFVKTTEQQK